MSPGWFRDGGGEAAGRRGVDPMGDDRGPRCWWRQVASDRWPVMERTEPGRGRDGAKPSSLKPKSTLRRPGRALTPSNPCLCALANACRTHSRSQRLTKSPGRPCPFSGNLLRSQYFCSERPRSADPLAAFLPCWGEREPALPGTMLRKRFAIRSHSRTRPDRATRRGTWRRGRLTENQAELAFSIELLRPAQRAPPGATSLRTDTGPAPIRRGCATASAPTTRTVAEVDDTVCGVTVHECCDSVSADGSAAVPTCHTPQRRRPVGHSCWSMTWCPRTCPYPTGADTACVRLTRPSMRRRDVMPV